MTEDDHTLKSRDNIRAALLARSKTSFDVSEKLGRNRTYLDDYLRGRKMSIASKFIQDLSKLLDVSRDILEGRESFRILPQTISMDLRFDREKLSEYLYLEEEVGRIKREISEGNGDGIAMLTEILPLIENKLQLSRMINTINLHAKNDAVIFPPSLFEEIQATAENLKVRRVDDSSMRNSNGGGYSIGDYYLYDMTHLDICAGGVFVALFRGHVILRQAETVGEDGTRTRLRPLNSDFPTIEGINGQDFRVTGKVIAHIRRV